MNTKQYEAEFLLKDCQVCGIVIKDHPRCALCGILAGDKHIEIDVYPYKGKKLCSACMERRGK